MQLQFIVALLVVLALCEGCAGMDPYKLVLGGNDKRNSSNFTNSPNQPETQGKGKGKAKMYSSGSDDGRCQLKNEND
uniref:Secreted protein n=1 Tax=Globodera pallida TaxID=36090 RepID=A0A183BN91_GLOPA